MKYPLSYTYDPLFGLIIKLWYQLWYQIMFVQRICLWPLPWRTHLIEEDLCDRINTLQWRHNGHDSISNHGPHHCLLNCLFRHRSKKTWKLRVTGLCAGNSPWTGEFPAQMASDAENVSIWSCHHESHSRWPSVKWHIHDMKSAGWEC